jgi:hypothetical protein
VIALYADHGTHEQFHAEFKTDLDLTRLPSQGHEASHATVSGADLERLGRFALFCALSALRGLV